MGCAVSAGYRGLCAVNVDHLTYTDRLSDFPSSPRRPAPRPRTPRTPRKAPAPLPLSPGPHFTSWTFKPLFKPASSEFYRRMFVHRDNSFTVVREKKYKEAAGVKKQVLWFKGGYVGGEQDLV